MLNFLTRSVSKSVITGIALSPFYRPLKSHFSIQKQTEGIYVQQFPANEPIEDRVNVMKLTNPSGYYFAVFDGHGGDFVSQYANKNLPHVIAEQLRKNTASANNKTSVQKSINQAFEIVEENVYNEIKQVASTNMRTITAGSCALVSLFINKTLYVANLGDCEAILIKQNGDITKLSNRHNIAEISEQQRLKKLFPNEPDIAVYPQTGGCYLKGRLQPTYSFGDFYLKFKELNISGIKNFTGPYVEHIPQIKSFEIGQDDRYLLLATDGLWDEYGHKDVARILSGVVGGANPGRYLIQNVLNKISQTLGVTFDKLLTVKNRRNYHDDISFVLVDLKALKM